MNRHGYAACAAVGAAVGALFCAVQLAVVQSPVLPVCGGWWSVVVWAVVGALFGLALWDERMRP